MDVRNILVDVSFLGWSMGGSESLDQLAAHLPDSLSRICVCKASTFISRSAILYHLTPKHVEISAHRKRGITLQMQKEGSKLRQNPFES